MPRLVSYSKNICIGSKHIGDASVLKGIELIAVGEIQVLTDMVQPIVAELLLTFSQLTRSKAITEEIT